MAKRNIFLVEHMETWTHDVVWDEATKRNLYIKRECISGRFTDVWYGANLKDLEKNMPITGTACRFTKVTPKDPLYPNLVRWAQEPVWRRLHVDHE